MGEGYSRASSPIPIPRSVWTCSSADTASDCATSSAGPGPNQPPPAAPPAPVPRTCSGGVVELEYSLRVG